jgi:(2Fe-2S) ferredoxin
MTRRPYRYHVFPCTGKSCGLERGEALAARFKELLPDRKDLGIRISASRCQGMCKKGPNVCVYPEGVVYHGVDESDVESIVEEHLRRGRPVSTLMQDRKVRD